MKKSSIFSINFWIILSFSILIGFIFRPGFMSFDSLLQFKQALGLTPYDDAHPVIMAKLWHFLLLITDNKISSLLFFNLIAYWIACYLIAYNLTQHKLSQLLLSFAIGLFPTTFILSLHIWKDVGMIIGFLYFVGFVLFFKNTNNRIYLFLSLLALIWAILMRTNALIAAIPLMFYIIYLYNNSLKKPTYKKFLLLSLCSIGLVCLSFKIINYGTNHTSTIGTVLTWDLGALTKSSQKNYMPRFTYSFPESEVIEAVNKYFNPKVNTTLFEKFEAFPDNKYNKILILDWVKAIYHQPLGYIKHRLYVSKTLLNLDGTTYYPFHIGIDNNIFGIHFGFLGKGPRLQEIATFFNNIANSLIYKNYLFYFISILLLFLIVLFHNTKKYSLQFILLLSGFISTSSLFVLAPAADYRYCAWGNLSCFLALILFLINLMNRRTKPEPSIKQ